MPTTDHMIRVATDRLNVLKVTLRPTRLCAIYRDFLAAERVRDELLGAQFLLEAIIIRQAQPGDLATELAFAYENKSVLKEVLADCALGAAVGLGLGALGALVLLTTHLSLFMASPIIAPLALMVNLATVGALLGGALGAEKRGTHYSTLVDKVTAPSDVALLVTTVNRAENLLAKIIIRRSLKPYY